MWNRERKREEKQQPRKYPALLSPTCALRAAAAAPSPHALVPHAASAFPHSTARARSRRYSQAAEAAAPLPALPLRALRHTECGVRSTQPRPPPPPAASRAGPRRRSFPSLCPRLANQQAARVGTGITDRRHQPIIARMRAVLGTRAPLEQAAVDKKRTAAVRGGAAAAAVGSPRGSPEGVSAAASEPHLREEGWRPAAAPPPLLSLPLWVPSTLPKGGLFV